MRKVKKVKKICQICKKIFEVLPYRKNKAKYCSLQCKYISYKNRPKSPNAYKFPKGHTINNGKHRSPATEFKKGHKPTGGFKKGNQINKGKKFPERSGKNSPTWKGGKIKNKAGYILIRKPEHPFCNGIGYVRESRLIVEQQIKRYLKSEEVTHHINRIRHDNRSENLMAFTFNSVHKRFHKNPNNVKPSEIIFDGRKIK